MQTKTNTTFLVSKKRNVKDKATAHSISTKHKVFEIKKQDSDSDDYVQDDVKFCVMYSKSIENTPHA